VSEHMQDPARVTEETLRSFESGLPDASEHIPDSPAARWQGALILVGLAAMIAVGVIVVVSRLL
jgi:hypothetical protein